MHGIYLAKEVSCKLFLKNSLFCDEIKEIFARFWSLHNNDKGVMAFKVVDKLHDTEHPRHPVHEADLQGHLVQSNLKENKISQCAQIQV